MGYSYDMSKESEQGVLLPEGDREFKIISCEETTSKAGNDMFIFQLEDKETGHVTDIYAVATPKKRWFLKSLLKSCGVEGGEDGIYNWDIDDVINKTISGEVTHVEETWINRENDEVTTKKHKIKSVEAMEGTE